MVNTIVFRFEWPPTVIGGLFIDEIDYKGLLYWYELILDEQKEIKRIKNNLKK